MTTPSTTIRVSQDQRELLRQLASRRSSTMAETLDAALESLRRETFYRGMANAEAELRSRPQEWREYVAERDAWLNADLG
jgi:predicted transcriptional regulator